MYTMNRRKVAIFKQGWAALLSTDPITCSARDQFPILFTINIYAFSSVDRPLDFGCLFEVGCVFKSTSKALGFQGLHCDKELCVCSGYTYT